MRGMLDAIFPGHGIDLGREAGRSPSPGGRWSRSPAPSPSPTRRPRVVILDEPTSSLDSMLAGQLLSHVRRFTAGGGSVVLISHLLGEVLDTADRIAVMRDAQVVALDRAAAFDRASLVRAMGSVVPRGGGEAVERGATRGLGAGGPRAPARPHARASLSPTPASRGARRLERPRPDGVPGAGLRPRRRRRKRRARWRWSRAIARSDGIFPLWSIAANISIASLGRFLAGPLIDPQPRARLRRGLAAAHRHPHPGHRQSDPVVVWR